MNRTATRAWHGILSVLSCTNRPIPERFDGSFDLLALRPADCMEYCTTGREVAQVQLQPILIGEQSSAMKLCHRLRERGNRHGCLPIPGVICIEEKSH